VSTARIGSANVTPETWQNLRVGDRLKDVGSRGLLWKVTEITSGGVVLWCSAKMITRFLHLCDLKDFELCWSDPKLSLPMAEAEVKTRWDRLLEDDDPV
jgi:hypothetical protein